jgi:ATP-dependent helicase Lhr and Lhr-like helicase
MADAFGRLHHDVQHKLHDMRWTALNAVQVDAIDHLLGEHPTDCVISAPTAGGKTEAAFLPILSAIAGKAGGGVRAMYIGPLKALINDQFRRVEDLCQRMTLPVHRWHGDVTESHRKHLLAAPAGLLLITPESLEAMFVLRPTAMPTLFGELQFVVIDEMHAFLGNVRGAQLISQLHRLRARTGADPLRIGLSATLGDFAAAGHWLRPDGRSVKIIEGATQGSEIAIKVRGFWQPPPPPATDGAEDAREGEDNELSELAQALLLAGRGKTNLVFANSKRLIELLADELTEQAKAMQLPDEIVVHHGSLSKETRESAEERLRAGRPCTAVCSNTLEMGIDIGAIDEVVQVSAPWSVASLVQRLGRSGRRPGSRRILRGYFLEQRCDSMPGFWDRLHLDFVRAIAAIELLLERFIEAPRCDRAHLSTLVQQILSCAAETGGIRAADLHERTIGSGAFARLGKPELIELLRELGTKDLLEQLPDATLVLGVKGQLLVGHYTFYAAFRAPVEFQVMHAGRLIGLLPEDYLPPPREHFILAGRRWRVEEIDANAKQVHVVPSRGRRPPQFLKSAPEADPQLHEKMRQLLAGSDEPRYLDATALEILGMSRAEAQRLDLASCTHAFDGGVRILLWGGTRLHRTLALALRRAELQVEADDSIGFDVEASAEKVTPVLRQLLEAPDAMELAEYADVHLGARVTEGDKLDELVPARLWRRAYAEERLDLAAAKRAAAKILDELGRA